MLLIPLAWGRATTMQFALAHFVSFLFFQCTFAGKKTSILSSSISFTTILPNFRVHIQNGAEHFLGLLS